MTVQAYTTVMILEHPDGSERVVILRRADGIYSYGMQWRSQSPLTVDANHGDWGPIGPDCGLYDSADTAETEARQRIAWLKAQFH